MATRTYEIRVAGALGPVGRQAFGNLDMEVEPTSTVLTAEVDQEHLHEILDKVRVLGLQLVDVVQVPTPLP